MFSKLIISGLHNNPECVLEPLAYNVNFVCKSLRMIVFTIKITGQSRSSINEDFKGLVIDSQANFFSPKDQEVVIIQQIINTAQILSNSILSRFTTKVCLSSILVGLCILMSGKIISLALYTALISIRSSRILLKYDS